MSPDLKDRRGAGSVDDQEWRLDPTVEDLAKELAARWIPQLLHKSWSERLNLLQQIHEQLQEDLEDLSLFSEISPALIREIIDGLSDGPITSFEQAHIYANSADRDHRRVASEWIASQRRRRV